MNFVIDNTPQPFKAVLPKMGDMYGGHVWWTCMVGMYEWVCMDMYEWLVGACGIRAKGVVAAGHS